MRLAYVNPLTASSRIATHDRCPSVSDTLYRGGAPWDSGLSLGAETLLTLLTCSTKGPLIYNCKRRMINNFYIDNFNYDWLIVSYYQTTKVVLDVPTGTSKHFKAILKRT